MSKIQAIEAKKRQIEEIDKKIIALQEKKVVLQEQIENLQLQDIKGLLNEINLPYPKVKSLLQDLAKKEGAKK